MSVAPAAPTLAGLETRLNALGEQHAGVHFASIGWILPALHDPDGHEINFYTLTRHTEPAENGPPLVVIYPRETSVEREVALQAKAADS